MWRHLAQIDSSGSGSVAGAVLWSMVVIAACIGAYFLYTQVKRWMSSEEDTSGGGFTFSDLRKLHREGKLTDQEYETARSKMSAAAKQMTEGLPDPLAGRPTAAGATPPSPPPDGPPRR